MSKVLPASCENGKVTVEGQEVQATILSQGTKSSTGIVVIDADKVTYIAMNTTDLSETIDKACEMIQDIALLFTSVASGMTGPTTAPPGSLPADVIMLQNKATQLLALKDNLK